VAPEGTVVQPLLIIFLSMWRLGLLPAYDRHTRVKAHTHYNMNVSVIDTLITPCTALI
jgi:hypothetical protein